MIRKSNSFLSDLENATQRKDIKERTVKYIELIDNEKNVSNLEKNSAIASYLADVLKHIVLEIKSTEVRVNLRPSSAELLIKGEDGYYENSKLICYGGVLVIPYIRLPEDLQGKGVFSRFIDIILDVAKNYNISIIEVDTVENPKLRRMLEKREFKLVSITNPYLPDSYIQETENFVKPYDMVKLL